MQLDFYHLPLKEQHFYRFYIVRCQDPTLLTFGGFAPLNMETSVQVPNITTTKIPRNSTDFHLEINFDFTDLFENIFVHNAHLYHGN